MNRSTLVAIVLVAAATFAPGQAPTTLTTEAVVTVRVKPDHAKIYMSLESKGGEATVSVENSLSARKDLLAAIDKLGLKNVKVAIQPERISKDREVSDVFPNAPVKQIIDTYETSQELILNVVETDPAKLQATVERITRAAANLGITGPHAQYIQDNFLVSRRSTGSTGGVRVVYESKTAWDDAMLAGMTLATEKAMRQANALAKGTGRKVTDVLSIDDITEGEPGADIRGNRREGSDEDYIEGELVRRVRVRLKVAVTK